MSNTLYVSDLDGTLLNSQIAVSRATQNIINGLIRQGLCFTYATARSLVSASRVTAGLHVNLPVIVYNGAFIMMPDTREILHSCFFSPEERNNAQEILRQHSVSAFVTSFLDGQEKLSWHTSHENEGMRDYLNSRAGDRRLRPTTTFQDLYQGDIFYFTCIGEKADLEPAWLAFQASGIFTCTFQKELYRPEYWLEVMPKKASKAEALKKLKTMVPCDRIVCFGDAVNDIAMFHLCDEAYAMENAVDELKSIATRTIGSNNSDSVARWLQTNAIFDR